MKNIEASVDEKTHILTIRVDLKKEFGQSSSGKSIIIASTEGNKTVPGAENVKMGVNIYRPA